MKRAKKIVQIVPEEIKIIPNTQPVQIPTMQSTQSVQTMQSTQTMQAPETTNNLTFTEKTQSKLMLPPELETKTKKKRNIKMPQKKQAPKEKKSKNLENILNDTIMKTYIDEEVTYKPKILEPLVDTMITIGGSYKGICIDERKMNSLTFDNKILQIKSNFYNSIHPTLDVVKDETKPKRGRPKDKNKKPKVRKPQGNGSSFNSQISFTILSDEIKDKQYNIGVFRNGSFRLSGLSSVKYLKDAVNSLDYLGTKIHKYLNNLYNQDLIEYKKKLEEMPIQTQSVEKSTQDQTTTTTNITTTTTMPSTPSIPTQPLIEPTKPENYYMEKLNIYMRNFKTHIKLNPDTKINLYLLIRRISIDDFVNDKKINTDKAVLKVEFKISNSDQALLKIFPSGKITILGLKKLDDAVRIYKYIDELLYKYKDEVIVIPNVYIPSPGDNLIIENMNNQHDNENIDDSEPEFEYEEELDKHNFDPKF